MTNILLTIALLCQSAGGRESKVNSQKQCFMRVIKCLDLKPGDENSPGVLSKKLEKCLGED